MKTREQAPICEQCEVRICPANAAKPGDTSMLEQQFKDLVDPGKLMQQSKSMWTRISQKNNKKVVPEGHQAAQGCQLYHQVLSAGLKGL